jgi:Holliday junction resolvasome RuvABC DNA-binding subunit
VPGIGPKLAESVVIALRQASVQRAGDQRHSTPNPGGSRDND